MHVRGARETSVGKCALLFTKRVPHIIRQHVMYIIVACEFCPLFLLVVSNISAAHSMAQTMIMFLFASESVAVVKSM